MKLSAIANELRELSKLHGDINIWFAQQLPYDKYGNTLSRSSDVDSEINIKH